MIRLPVVRFIVSSSVSHSWFWKHLIHGSSPSDQSFWKKAFLDPTHLYDYMHSFTTPEIRLSYIVVLVYQRMLVISCFMLQCYNHFICIISQSNDPASQLKEALSRLTVKISLYSKQHHGVQGNLSNVWSSFLVAHASILVLCHFGVVILRCQCFAVLSKVSWLQGDYKFIYQISIYCWAKLSKSLTKPCIYIYIQLWGHLWVEDVWNHVRSHDSFNFYFGSSLIFGISSQIPKFCRFSLLKLKQRHGCNTSATPKPTVKTEENVREESENHFVDGRNPAPVINWLAVCRGFFPWTAL